jgi:hypothetical protein
MAKLGRPSNADIEKSQAAMTALRPFSLVCEGDCNPSIDRLNKATAKLRSRSTSILPDPADMSYDTIVGLRNLKHTPHYRIGADKVACSVCGRERVW